MAKSLKKEKVRILWSDDPDQLVERKQTKKIEVVEIIPDQITLKIRVEKNNRGGKLVSVIYNFPSNPEFFKKLTKELKSSCGTGGSFKQDVIEIQGDHRHKLKELLEKKSFKVKLAGG